jgi:hypothetical protein
MLCGSVSLARLSCCVGCSILACFSPFIDTCPNKVVIIVILFAADCLLGLRVRIPLEAWMFVVSVVCCQVEVSATGRSLVQRSPTDCVVSFCVI